MSTFDLVACVIIISTVRITKANIFNLKRHAKSFLVLINNRYLTKDPIHLNNSP